MLSSLWLASSVALWPVVLLQGYSAPQLQQIQEIYRLARESVEAARPPRRLPFPPAFSLN